MRGAEDRAGHAAQVRPCRALPFGRAAQVARKEVPNGPLVSFTHENAGALLIHQTGPFFEFLKSQSYLLCKAKETGKNGDNMQNTS